ncbi:MAG: hypothetical protein J3T61_00140 [Candidatus Brocadiales bacterium]|nr:hypothetical protein [Candidatus Bathyanammoxibius sp.]
MADTMPADRSGNRFADKVLIPAMLIILIALLSNGVMMYRNEGVMMERMDTFDREILRLTKEQQALRSDQRDLEILVYWWLPQEQFPE